MSKLFDLNLNIVHIIALKDNQFFDLKKELEITKNAYVNLDKKRNTQVTELQKEIERLKKENETKIWGSDIEHKIMERMERIEFEGLSEVRRVELNSFLGWLLCDDDY